MFRVLFRQFYSHACDISSKFNILIIFYTSNLHTEIYIYIYFKSAKCYKSSKHSLAYGTLNVFLFWMRLWSSNCGVPVSAPQILLKRPKKQTTHLKEIKATVCFIKYTSQLEDMQNILCKTKVWFCAYVCGGGAYFFFLWERKQRKCGNKQTKIESRQKSELSLFHLWFERSHAKIDCHRQPDAQNRRTKRDNHHLAEWR